MWGVADLIDLLLSSNIMLRGRVGWWRKDDLLDFGAVGGRLAGLNAEVSSDLVWRHPIVRHAIVVCRVIGLRCQIWEIEILTLFVAKPVPKRILKTIAPHKWLTFNEFRFNRPQTNEFRPLLSG